eukprot:12885108-Prorocentrum_lima.AAC.1
MSTTYLATTYMSESSGFAQTAPSSHLLNHMNFLTTRIEEHFDEDEQPVPVRKQRKRHMPD